MSRAAGAIVIALMVASAPVSASAQSRTSQSDTTVVAADRPVYSSGSLEAEVTIGVAHGPEEYIFESITSIAVTPNGLAYIVDPRGQSVRSYFPDGRFDRKYGSAGRGPGRYSSPLDVALMGDGRVLVCHNLGLNVYNSSGLAIAQWKPSASLCRVTVAASGQILVTATERAGGEWVTRILRPDGSEVAVVPAPQLNTRPWYIDLVPGGVDANGHESRVIVPYGPQNHWAWSPLGYMVTGFSGRYALDLRRPVATVSGSRSSTATGQLQLWQPGDPVVSIRRTVGPVAIPSAERSELRAQVDSFLHERSYSSWNGRDIPMRKPAFRKFQIGEEGRIWVQVHAPSREEPDESAVALGPRSRSASASVLPAADPVRDMFLSAQWREDQLYDVYEPDGRYLGQVKVPDGVTLHWMSGNTVWGSTRLQDGALVARRFRVRWTR